MARSLAREHREIEAAVCFSDLVALGMLSGFAEHGVSVGTDFRLVGFDDIEECSLVYPQLSSIRCDTARFGETSAETLLRWIDEGQRPADVQRWPVTLVPRHSSLGKAPRSGAGDLSSRA
jgi:LacI family transcriptional regulator